MVVKERLQKVLARAGVASRRKAEDLITEGRVTVNGKVAELGMSVSAADTIRVDGKRVERKVETVSYMLNKPSGVVTTLQDERGRDNVMNYLPKVPGLHPVGRLDMDSEGLLLLTTDGEMTLQLTHPRYEKEKEYRVWTREGTLSAAALALLEQGIELEDGMAKVVVAKLAEGGCTLVLNEGRNRQVRRMLAAVGYLVTRLVRTRIGKLELGDLPTGEYRELSAHEFKLLGYTQSS
ncbi:MAG: rRNA pseudouridine synthase [Trueperaceae bacterium]|nr:rRNA pseudouridine synthase [Trueperaceae bacterium]